MNYNDIDIIKALEDATNPLKDISPEGASLIGIDTLLHALDLINRQKAEIERLKTEANCADGYAEALVEQSKSEAIREVERKIKAHAYYIDAPKEHRVVDEDDIDAVIKEMTEQSVNYGSSMGQVK